MLPSGDLWHLIVAPSLVATAAGVVPALLLSLAVQRSSKSNWFQLLCVLVLSGLVLIELKGVFSAMAFDWEDHVPRGTELLTSLRYTKLLLACGAFSLLWATRSALSKWIRILGSMGFAFGVLAVVRLIVILHGADAAVPAKSGGIPSGIGLLFPASKTIDPLSIESSRPRRVVWVIFDESDFGQIYGQTRSAQIKLPNFDRLALRSVFATNANSPASATLYSIPALLTSAPIGGKGVIIGSAGSMTLDATNGVDLPFRNDTSIFGAIGSRGLTSSVLGFYHPYCRLFKLSRCQGFSDMAFGELDGALWANIPDSVSNRFRSNGRWGDITRDSLALLPSFLDRDDALTFVHLNIPHLPARYADKVLGLRQNSDPLVEYSRNLLVADKILGGIVDQLQGELTRHQLLLVVSADHWLRNRWYRANEPELSKPIPFMAWIVGETKGTVISKRLSTIHTAPMILGYLSGDLNSQSEIASWLASQRFYPTFIAPGT